MTYLQAFDELIGDQRTRRTLQETIRGIIGAGSLICQQIAAHAEVIEDSGRRRPLGSPSVRATRLDRTASLRSEERCVLYLRIRLFRLSYYEP